MAGPADDALEGTESGGDEAREQEREKRDASEELKKGPEQDRDRD